MSSILEIRVDDELKKNIYKPPKIAPQLSKEDRIIQKQKNEKERIFLIKINNYKFQLN